MLRHACGYALANKGHDTRALQAYLGHRNIQHTVRYTEMSPTRIHRNAPQGIYTRLQSHASGRRSGDQFCVYVADRLVLLTLSQDDITAIASGRHQMDAFVRRYVHENLSYRFVILPDGASAYAIEAAIKSGGWEHGRSLLNPGG
jgi:Phage integrase family